MKVRLLAGCLSLCCLLSWFNLAVAQDSIDVSFTLPLRSLQITSPFGYRIHPINGSWQFHNGIDLRAHQDTVFAIMDGVVVQTGYDHLSGIYIKIAHAADLISIYSHLSVPWVFAGVTVTSGQLIGLSGSSGRTTGEHLHFSVKYKRKFIDPLIFLRSCFTK